MGEGYNFQQLKAEVLSRSRATEWEVAKNEWSLVGISEADEPETCLCGHYPIIELCTIHNRVTLVSVDVGNVCVNRFLGFRSDIIFQSLKRIRKDITKSVGAEATVFFYERHIINAWEYKFQQNTMRKRNLTGAQMAARQKINEKVIASIRKRGLL
jgi:hypothetical protein